MYKGIAGSEGIGIGNVVIIEEHEIVIENKKITDTDAEIARLQGAIEKFVNDTNAMADRMEKTVGAKDADILRGHIQMLQDPTIEEQITALIVSEKITAEKALDQVLEQTAEIFAQIPDELLQQRATDFRDIKARILKILLGIEDYDISAAPAGTVLVAHDLTPSMTAGIVAENIAGILTEVGGRTSHSAILARAMEIPAVLSIDGICTSVKNGDRVVLDGTSGEAIVNPDAAARTRLHLPSDVPIFLVMSGSMGFGKLAVFAAELAIRCHNNEHIVIICGNNTKIKRILQNEFKFNKRVHVIGYTNQVSLFMDACDVIYTKPGGLTSTEALVKNIPIVHTAPIPGCEAANVAFFKKRHLSVSSKRLSKQIELGKIMIENKELNAEMIRAQRRERKPYAAIQIVGLLEELTHTDTTD